MSAKGNFNYLKCKKLKLKILGRKNIFFIMNFQIFGGNEKLFSEFTLNSGINAKVPGMIM